MKLADFKIKTKISLAFCLVVAVFICASAAVQLNLGVVTNASKGKDIATIVTDAGDDMFSAVLEQQNAVRGYILTQDQSFLDTYREQNDVFTEALNTFETTTQVPEQREKAQQLGRAVADWRKNYSDQEIRWASNPATVDQARASVGTVRLAEIRKLHDDISADQDAVYKARDLKGIAAVKTSAVVLWAGAAIAVLLASIAGWLLARGVATPTGQMTSTMLKLADGDNTVEVPALGRKDEIGQMASAVQVFKEAAIEKVRLEKEAADGRRQIEEERQRVEAERLEAANQQALVVNSIATGLEKLASGDLIFRLNKTFAPEYEKLRTDFNGAMAQLQNTMKVISATTQGIRTGTDEISQAADDLSKRTEQQAASLEETAAALDQITATVRKTAEGANHARDVVSTAKADAEHSGRVVREAVSAMGEIEQSAQKISQIIGVIDEIAFQTNLLALNAGVEAARAGDAGRGFAVVASEVRALAQRSADAAKEIKTLISASTQQVGAGVNLVGQTGEALNRIVTQVADINSVVSDIAASAQEQATGLHQVNTAVNQMDQVTQQNAAMVEESTAASHSLAQETQELAQLISRFQVGDDAVVSPMRRETRAHASASRPALKSVSGGGHGGGALRKPQAAVEQDSWEEF